MQYIEIITCEEFYKRFPEAARRIYTGSGHAGFCKAVRVKDGIAGTYVLPKKSGFSAERITFGYYLTDEKLFIVDETEFVSSSVKDMQEDAADVPESSSRFLYELFSYLIKDDGIFLHEYDIKLSKLEASLLENKDGGFDRAILEIRKILSSFGFYYAQLSDMCDTLRSYAEEIGDDKTESLFELFSDRTKRLYSMVEMLKEYSMQLREMHQTQVDLKQNKIMKVLTIVTTFFMPLTLIAGWYGMNFKNMPELSSQNGYVIVCIVSVLCVVAEIIIFKIKKWF